LLRRHLNRVHFDIGLKLPANRAENGRQVVQVENSECQSEFSRSRPGIFSVCCRYFGKMPLPQKESQRGLIVEGL
jgi:hypothetical protein